MELTGQIDIDLPQQQVWDALNDIEVLMACIPGCEQLEWIAENQLEAAITTKIGPVKARFKGLLTLENLDEPTSYTLLGEGKGGAAGFAKGKAHVMLSEENAITTLSYSVDASVGGKLAQIGARLIKGSTTKLADKFFDTFKEVALTRNAND